MSAWSDLQRVVGGWYSGYPRADRGMLAERASALLTGGGGGGHGAGEGVRKALAAEVAAKRVDVPTAAAIRAFQAAGLDRLDVIAVDRSVHAAPVHVVEKMLEWSRVDRDEYKAEMYDCDDFAAALKVELARKLGFNGVAVVLDASAGHAYCAILTLDDEGQPKAHALEPQTDRWVALGSGMYRAEKGLVRI